MTDIEKECRDTWYQQLVDEMEFGQLVSTLELKDYLHHMRRYDAMGKPEFRRRLVATAGQQLAAQVIARVGAKKHAQR